MSFKRHRSQSETSSTSSTSSASAHPTPKAQRTLPTPDASLSTAHPLLCTLPPTCNHHPTPIANSKDLETHYATYHAHVCEERGCNCVFPDARLLEIHQTECHDPLAAVRKDRGEKIFACHLVSCGRMFLTPKARRLHLIQGHGYPKEYYFAVTNKGVGGLLKRWGEGASLIRGQWKAREPPVAANATQESQCDAMDMLVVEEDDDEPEDEATSAPTLNEQKQGHVPETSPPMEGVDSLTESLNSMTLVPPTIRFGRGGKNGGFGNDQHSRVGKGYQRGRGRRGARNNEDSSMKGIEVTHNSMPPDSRGRGRGRGIASNNESSEVDVLGYVPRGVRARGMLHVRGGVTRGRANS